ncbi:hypothetical protein [Candidatus Filomicrobium marinum]|nr:hypothetical protein [Candidatus Filomicrobium marinum]
MPSGYEKSPDYGGPPPTWRREAIFIVVMIALFGFGFWMML